jgi:hypothetical protein
VLLKIVYGLTWRTLGLVAVLVRGDRAIAAEMLVLRHENAVLRRQAGRVRYEPVDRAWFAALARIVSRRRWAEVFPVTPATLLAWHRSLAAGKYDTSGRRRPGRPPATPGIRRLVLRLARDNPLGGHRRIQGELLKPGIAVAPSTVWEILRVAGIDPAPRRPGPTWRQFLHTQAAGILAEITVYAAELKVVLARRLWPRTIVQPPLTEGDRAVLAAQALQNQRRDDQRVHVSYDDLPPPPPRPPSSRARPRRSPRPRPPTETAKPANAATRAATRTATESGT